MLHSLVFYTLQGGVRNLNLQAGAVANNNVGISFVGLASRPIYAVTLSQVSIMQASTHGLPA